MKFHHCLFPLLVCLAAGCIPEDLGSVETAGVAKRPAGSDQSGPLVGTTNSVGATPSPSPAPSPTESPDPTKLHHPAGIYAYLDYPSGEYTGIQCDLRITDAPSPSPTAGVIFWSHQFYMANSTGYIGLQIVGEKRKAIFSIWDAVGSDTGNPFGGEGIGYQKIIDYDWQPKKTYRIAVTRLSSNATEAQWKGTVTDLSNGSVTYLATHRVPASHGGIKSSVVWTEYATHRTCETPYTRAEFSAPQVTGPGGPIASSRAIGTYHYNVYSACPRSNFDKLASQSLVLEAGVGATRKTSQGTQLW